MKVIVDIHKVAVTIGPGSKPDQKYDRRRDRQKYVRKNFACVHCERVNFKVTGINFMTVFITRRDAACF